MNLLDLYCKISIDDSDFQDGIKRASSGFSELKSGVGTVVKAVSGIGAVVTTVSTALATVGVDAAAEVRAEASAFSQTFGDMQDTATEAIGRVAQESGILQTRLNTLGSKIYAFARSSGGDATESMNLMERALRAAADSAAYYDTSVEQATETLQSFLKGNYENDAALGLSATETTRNAAAMELFGQKFNDLTEIQKQETLLKMVEDSQALSGALGQASREADGWENVLGNLKESWRQLKAAFGEPILDVVTPMIQNMTVSVQNFTAQVDREGLTQTITTGFSNAVAAGQNLIATIQNLLPIVTTAAGAFVSLKAGMAIQGVVQGFQQAQVAISLLSMEVGKANLAQAALNGTMKAGEVVVALLTGKMTLAQLAQAAMTKAQAALNTVMNANPIALVVTAIGTLVTAFGVLYATNEDFRNMVQAAWQTIKETISGAVSAIVTFFTETIPNAAQTAVDWLKGIPEQMRQVGQNLLMGLWNGISDKVQWLKDKVSGVVDTIKGWFTGPDGFDEHSPSKWSMSVSEYIMQGLAIGMENGLGQVMETVNDIIDEVKTRFNTLADAFTAKQDISDLEYQLWERTLGQGATEAEKYDMQLQMLQNQQSNQVGVVEAAAAAYQAVVEQYGENSAESLSYQKTLLEESLAYQDLVDQINEVIAAKQQLYNTNMATVSYADSTSGRATEAAINAVSGNTGNQDITLNANLVMPDGSKFASWQLPFLINAGRAAGTPIANPQVG